MEYEKSIEHATSVKGLHAIRMPTKEDFGLVDMEYLPVFSVFDIGRINPPVPLDNSTICLMQGFNFELLRKELGIESHYRGVVIGENITTASAAISKGVAPTIARVHFVNRVMPQFVEGKGWDYSMFENPEDNNHMHPIEFISRNDLPPESSVWKRVKKGEITVEDLGLPADFKPGDKVPLEMIPILDYSTKFEPDDRYVTAKEAQRLMGISDERFAAINETTRKASDFMTDYAASRGFQRLDGKVEYLTLVNEKGEQVDMLADAVCTWHEDRLVTEQGVGISKQRIRGKVKKLNPEWYAEIDRAKDYAKEHGVEDFRTVMDPNISYVSPSPEFFEAVNTLFRAGTNQWVGARVYNIFPAKDESIAENLERAVEEFNQVK
jgi:phosphoribosylaminoimidazole-succinocarboxamide synthase